MFGATDIAALRGIVGRIAYQVGKSATHVTLDEALTQLELPASTSGDTKAERVESSVAAMPDGQVPKVARRILDSYRWLDAPTRNQLQDLLWAGEPHPPIPKRTRREVARALAWDDLLNHYQRFRTLLGALFVLDDDDWFGVFTGRDHSLGAHIDQHVHRNPDWTVEETFDALGAIDASDRRFALLLEGIVSGGTVLTRLPSVAWSQRSIRR